MASASGAARLRRVAGHICPGPCAGASDALVVVITGCTSGLGLALAQEYIRLGHRVAGCGRRADRVETLQREHREHLFRVVDVTDGAAVAAFAEEVSARFGDVDVLVCNAGLGGKGAMPWDIPVDHLSASVDTGLKGVMYTCKYFVPLMLRGLKASGAGRAVKRVINFSSGIAHTSNPFTAEYCAVKYGVEGYSKCVAQAFQFNPAWKGRIICVPFSPGVVRTEMMTKPGYPTAEAWSKEAAPYLLAIGAADNGSSMVLPGYYPERMVKTWTVPADAKMNSRFELP